MLPDTTGGCKSLLDNYDPGMRRFLPLLLLPFVTLRAAEQKPSLVTVRLHAEGKESDGETFGTPITLLHPPKKIIIRKVPIINERDFVAFYPFSAADGTLGAYFKLDAGGTNKLESHSTEFRDTLIVALINGRVASAMMMDKKITDGVMVIPSGFLPLEIAQLQTKYPTIGKEKSFEEQKKKALAALKADQKAAPKPGPTPKAESTPNPPQ
ncbi:MAG: hypothetical protein WCQ57_04865 [Verrucomicrobiota bacterium]